jgi:hypothetical protein
MKTPIDPKLFQHRIFGGNPPVAPYRYGWIIRLGGPATKIEHQWLKLHGYRFSGGKWCREDRSLCR